MLLLPLWDLLSEGRNAGWAWEGCTGGGFLSLCLCLPGDGSWSTAASLCTDSLSSASHSGWLLPRPLWSAQQRLHSDASMSEAPIPVLHPVLPCLLVLIHLPSAVSMCCSLRYVCVLGRGPLLNYSCPICNFKGRVLEVLSHLHDIDVTLRLWFNKPCKVFITALPKMCHFSMWIILSRSQTLQTFTSPLKI